ncbi:cytochrome P450 [Micromonospora sp. WMMD987]|uniref:cytochrome P450 family protein n=1 Tax=Micromonospora TaxID=1873 RepID=UPI00249B2A34|nr:cytochrome P450 [Micromonospora sp. WMMD987]WFE95358.1 cytochrome P450 [Micromonospora sp. WMMD987]
MSDSPAVLEFTGTARDIAASMHTAGPVQRVRLPNGVPVWLVTRHTEVREALSDPRLSNHDRNDWFDQGALTPQVRSAMNTSMLRLDPPDHTRLRKLIAKAFVPRRIEALRPRVGQLTGDLLDRLAAGGAEADLITGYASPLPIQVICELLGVAVEDRADYREWADAFAAGLGAPVFPVQAVTDFVEHLQGLIARRRAEPDDALLSALIAARDQADRLTEDELISTAFLFIVAGHETTTNLIGNGIYLLLRNPELADRIRAHPEELPRAIEEFLRYESPVTGASLRTATEAMDLFGAEVAAGDLVMLSLHAANRDGTAFPDADGFLMDRERNPHLSFGYGIHFCMGAPLARLEAQVAIGNFLTRFPQARLAVDADAVEWRPGLLTRGLAALPVRLAG